MSAIISENEQFAHKLMFWFKNGMQKQDLANMHSFLKENPELDSLLSQDDTQHTLIAEKLIANTLLFSLAKDFLASVEKKHLLYNSLIKYGYIDPTDGDMNPYYNFD